jgi:hypothetical protein
MFLTNSLIGLRAVGFLDGVAARSHPGLATLLALSPRSGI